MKYLLTALLLIPGYLFSQSFAPADTCFNNAVSLITPTTARLTTNTGNGDVLGTFVVLKYVRVGQTDTITSSAAWPNGIRNLTGLVPSTQYVYYWGFSNGPEWVPQLGRYYFTTTANTTTYAAERATVFPYTKHDSGLIVPRVDTSLYRSGGTTGGNIVFKSPFFYGYNGSYWQQLAVDSAGILPMLNLKVDSVVVTGDSLFYYCCGGVAHGYILPINLLAWKTTGNSGTNPASNFVGTTDSSGLMFKVNNVQSGFIDFGRFSTSLGYGSLMSDTFSEGYNTAIGYQAMKSNLYGSQNVAIGYNPLFSSTYGTSNIAIGAQTLYSNTLGGENIAIGNNTMYSNTEGGANIAIGQRSMLSNISGQLNISIGYSAMQERISGTNNIALGNSSLGSETDGQKNVAIGASSLQNINNSSNNVGLGNDAGYDLLIGSHNTLLGDSTGQGIETGYFNTIVGARVIGLPSSLSNNIILSDGEGNIRMQFNSSGNPKLTAVPAGVGTKSLRIDGSGNVTYADTTSGGGSSTVIPSIQNFRLTTESGVPVSITDRTAQGTIYMTPFTGNHISLYSGSAWVDHTTAEISLSLTVTSGKNYDVFAYNNSGTITLELSAAWATDATRTDALTRQDGVLVKSGATTRRWIGTIRASGTNTTEDSEGGTTTQVGGKRFVWNAYNQVRRTAKVIDQTDSWSYTTATWRQENGNAGNQVEYVTGDASLLIEAQYNAMALVTNTASLTGIGISSTTTPSGFPTELFDSGTEFSGVVTRYVGSPGLGYFYVAPLEKGQGGGTSSWYGDNNTTDMQSGLSIIITN